MNRRSGLIMAVLAVAACAPPAGGPSPTVTSTAVALGSTTTTIAAQEAAEAFQSCLAARDVPIGSIPLDGSGRPRLDLVVTDLDFSDPNVAAAVTECSDLLGGGALAFLAEDSIRRSVVGRLETFSGCVRDQGLDFPDPIPGFDGVGSPYPVAEIPYSDSRLAEAVALCRALVLGDLPGLDQLP